MSSGRGEQGGRIPRDFTRQRSQIPVCVRIDTAWSGTGPRILTGLLLDVSRGGGAVRLAGTLPPRTRLSLSLPPSLIGRRLRAEVVWTSVIPGDDVTRAAVYGLRWLEALEPELLELLQPLLAPGSA